jgi:putative ABC transport system permease protein
MLTHLFKLIWNRKKQNALLITEMFVSFLVMFFLFTMMVHSYKNYKTDMGFDYSNVWVVTYTPPDNINSNDSAIQFHDALKNSLQSMPQIKAISFTGGNTPFSMNSSNTGVSYDKNSVMTNYYTAEESLPEVLSIKIKEGRWFTKADLASKLPAIVITDKLSQQLFRDQSALGKEVNNDASRMKVIGVIEDMKDKGSYQAIEAGLYRPVDSTSAGRTGTILLKIRPDADAAFESRLFKILSNTIGTNIEIEHMDDMLRNKNKMMLVPMIIAMVVAGFLIINVALGLFGVLWYNINKRKGEIGLRRAVGATGNSISRQLLGEALVLCSLSVLLGSFFAVQFPLLRVDVFDLTPGTYITAIILAIGFIYLLALCCALYPGRQAAAIYPAVALHEE